MALDQELAHFLEVLLDPEVEGLPMETVEPPILSDKPRYSNNKASVELAETFLEIRTEPLPVPREEALEEASHQAWVELLEVGVEPESEGLPIETDKASLVVSPVAEGMSLVLENSSPEGVPEAL